MPELPARKAHPNQRFGYTNADGDQVEIKADSKGRIRPKDAHAATILAGFGLEIVPTASKPRSTAARRSSSSGRRSTTRTTRTAAAAAPTAEAGDSRGPGHPDESKE